MSRKREEHDWPDCSTPDCAFKSCRWAGTGMCYGCSTLNLGRAEMERRYAATRAPDGSWNGRAALPATTEGSET